MFDEVGGGGTMQADTEQVRSAALEVGMTADGLDLMLRNLMDNLSPLQTLWQGRAGTVFQEVRTAFDGQMLLLNGALRSIGEDVGLTSADYANADDDIAQNMSSHLAGTDASQAEISRLLDSDTTEVQTALDSGATSSQIEQLMNSQ
jgi:WXG100 family type VII secretion target